MKRIVLALATATLFASPGFAQSQATMNATAARDAKAADAALNAQYATLVRRSSSASRILLRAAQRSWIGFRDNECKYEASAVQGGSAYPMVYSGCLRRLTDERTRQLRRLSQCSEGDLSCPR